MLIGRYVSLQLLCCISTKSNPLGKCEADLPEALRFGKVEVSCEGWSRAGDPYVLKGR